MFKISPQSAWRVPCRTSSRAAPPRCSPAAGRRLPNTQYFVNYLHYVRQFDVSHYTTAPCTLPYRGCGCIGGGGGDRPSNRLSYQEQRIVHHRTELFIFNVLGPLFFSHLFSGYGLHETLFHIALWMNKRATVIYFLPYSQSLDSLLYRIHLPYLVIQV